MRRRTARGASARGGRPRAGNPPGVTLSSRSTETMLGATSSSLPPAGRFGAFGEGGEGIVLAEDLAGQECQDRAQLAAGDGAADAGRRRADRATAAFQHLFHGGFEHHREALGVGLGPVGPVHHQDRGVPEIPRGFEAGDLVDVRDRSIREAAQAVHGLADFRRAERWTRGSQPGRGGCGQVPVDQGLGRAG